MKICTKCKGNGPFSVRDKRTGSSYSQCKKCRSEIWRESYERNKQKWLATKAVKAKQAWRNDLEGSRSKQRDYKKSLAKAAVEYLGSGCGRCDETDPLVLQIDHIFGGGEAERRNGILGPTLYVAILRGERDGELQLLCANCHRIKIAEELLKSKPNKRSEAVRRSRARARAKALALLGNQCCKCEFKDRRALEFDHVEGDGPADREARRQFGSHHIVSLVLSNPKRFQLLCATCNWRKRMQSKHERGGGRPILQPKHASFLGDAYISEKEHQVMSQIRFESKHNDLPIHILSGYDPPCGHYFCTIFLPKDAEGEDQLLFSSMDDELSQSGGYASPEEVLEKITLLGIEVPAPEAWLEIIKKGEGNVVYRYSAEQQKYIWQG